MLVLIQKERPEQKIKEVISFEKNQFGFYSVKVDMETPFLGTTIKHTKVTLPYPFDEYLKLNPEDRFNFRWEAN